MMREIDNPAIQQAYSSFPESQQKYLMALRALVLDVAEALELPGGIEEAMKWGQPSYLPVKPRIGTTVRIGSFDEQNVALYFNCQTMLVETFRALFGDSLSYSKNRAVLLNTSISLPDQEIRLCVKMALRYHLDKK